MKTFGLKKIGLFIFLGCISFSFLSAMPFIVTHAEHDCSGDDHCPVCIQLYYALERLEQLDTAALRPVVIGAPGAAEKPEQFPGFCTVPVSAVALKVRINT
jgi:hypothetical protein